MTLVEELRAKKSRDNRELLDRAADRIEELERKQSEGEWVIAVDSVEATFICSKCGYSYIEADPEAKTEYNYCPNCGAKMKGE